jgi:hypothetical protein
LQVGLPIVNKDISHLRIQDKCNAKKYIKRLPEEYEKLPSWTGYITKEALGYSS